MILLDAGTFFCPPSIHPAGRQAGSLRCSRLIHSTIDGSKWTATNSVGKLKKLQEKNEIPIRLSVAVRRHRHHQLSSVRLMFDGYFPFWRLVFLFALASLVLLTLQKAISG